MPDPFDPHSTPPGSPGADPLRDLEGIVAAGPDPDRTATCPPPQVPLVGLTPHARGGLGEVFRATDPDLHRTVAVKFLQERHARNPDARHRFLIEAEVTARLEHPSVVPVYGLYPNADRPAYAMRFVEGRTLAEAVTAYHAGPPDPIAFRRLLQSFLQVCQAVAYAHSRGVIHRDLKPANVMLGRFGETLVVDWGLAKVVGRPEGVRSADGGEETLVPSSGDSNPSETAMGSAVGTPAYMSPEQAAGRWDVIAQASDVYGLGAVLYTVLTGKPPLEKGNWPEQQQKIQRGDFPRPRQVKPEVPEPLQAVCLKAMAVDPKDRYPSAAALAADVEHWLADEPVAAYREPLPTRARRWMRAHRSLVTATAALLVAALAAAGGGLVLLGQTNRQVAAERNAARAAAADARAAAEEAEAVNAFLTDDLLGQADPDKNPGRKQLTVEEVLTRAAERIDGNPKFAEKPTLEATIRLAMGKTFFKLGNAAEAERHLKRAVDLRRAHLPPDNSRTLAAQEALADFLNRGQERFRDALPLARETWVARKRVLGPRDRDTLDSLNTYAAAATGAGELDLALDLLRECLAGQRETLGPHHPDTLGTMNGFAIALAARGRYEEAGAYHRESFEYWDRQPVQEASFPPAGNYALNLYQRGGLDEAEAILTRYVPLAERHLPSGHPAVINLRSFLARVWIDQGKPDRAVGPLEEILATQRKQFPNGHWRVGLFLVDIGRARLALGQPGPAADALAEGRAVYKAHPPMFAIHVPWSDACHGMALVALKKYAEAEPLLVGSELKLRDTAACPRRHYRQVVEHLVKLYEATGKPAEAAKWRAELGP